MLVRVVKSYPLPAIVGVGLVAGLTVQFVFRAPELARWVFLGTLLTGGGPLVLQTLRGMLRGRFAADIVAMLAIVTALALGQYFAGAVIALMQSGGEALERYAMGRASQSLEALLARAPRVGHRLRGEQVEEVSVNEILVGDHLLIRPGDLVPVDGEVTEGSSAVDQSALTGEPLPIRAVRGTPLLSGSVNLDGAIEMRALRPAERSQYQQIVSIVELARREKPPIQRLADRFAVWFTPATLAMCGVAWLVTGTATSVLAVLVVATPCPLILATPIAVIAGISRAADLGVIVKTGAAIEQLGRAGAVVFDKTGTLTLGHPTVEHVAASDGASPDDVLRLAAAVEQLSSHHLGTAIVEAGRQRVGTLPPATDFQETAGAGVLARVEGRGVAVGSARFLARHGVSVAETPDDHTTAYVAVDGRLVGAIEFADRLRHAVPSLLQRLAVLGVTETVMLTGDRESNAEIIAGQAGIRTVRANLLPADKVAAVQELKRRYGTVAMVGDGINDAPALAAATVGIAMGEHGTAISAEAADIVLLVDDISRVGDAMTISRRMRRIALESIGVGLGVSFALMVVAALGWLTPALGAVMQEALDAAVILNALRVHQS
ncbi:MAG TPA: heavy metal translocating P-type ATPase [Gemmatimonadales bacterium]|nr:heavy metal translocating P-type ATPase [Gemmatimonadales bacterium]